MAPVYRTVILLLALPLHFTSASPILDDPQAIAPLYAPKELQNAIPGSFIVIVKDHVQVASHVSLVEATHLDGSEDSQITQIYDGQVKGYAGKFSNATIKKLRRMPEVHYIEYDQVVFTSDVDKTAPWGLARISHRQKLGLGTFREASLQIDRYIFDNHGGEGVDVYVLDTGINIAHREFEGRARWGKLLEKTTPIDAKDLDGHGHGTHCAGTIASRKYGVAKKANVIAVKVLGDNGAGPTSDVIAGVVWASTQASEKLRASRAEIAATGKTLHKGSVVNMSVGGPKSRAFNDAVNKAVEGGVHFAVAAGNSHNDACNYSPSGAAEAVTVGASTLEDSWAWFSNNGPCVDVIAPGMNILSTWNTDDTSSKTLSGTSMASPHVAGLMAYLLSIYPSDTFNPPLKGSPLQVAALGSIWTRSIRTVASTVHAVAAANLPTWAAGFLPKVQTILAPTFTPAPAHLTPSQLKATLVDLASSGMLTGVPNNTANKLVFNNATALKYA